MGNNYVKPKNHNPTAQKIIDLKSSLIKSTLILGSTGSTMSDIPDFIDGTNALKVDTENSKIITALASEVVESMEVSGNLKTRYIYTNEDKVKIYLREYSDNIQKHNDIKLSINQSKNYIISLMAMIFTLITTYMATDFKKFFFSTETWKAIYVVVFIISILYLAQNISTYFKCKKEYKNLKLDDEIVFIEKLIHNKFN